jgi:hypothetical protein
VIQGLIEAIFIIDLAGSRPIFNWALKAGSNSGLWQSDEGRAIPTDSAGNVFFVGTFFYTVDFDPSQILRYDGTGAFIDIYASGGGLTAPSYLVFGR